jgi:hypothetical protein
MIYPFAFSFRISLILPSGIFSFLIRKLKIERELWFRGSIYSFFFDVNKNLLPGIISVRYAGKYK